MKLVPLLLSAAAIAVLPVSPASADWLTFRGPYGNGFVESETAPPAKLSQDAIAWKAELPGRGLSSPVIVGDQVFVTASSGPDQNQLHVIAFNAGDGAKVWERTFWATGRTMSHGKTCVAAPSPVSDGKHIYALFSSNDLFCLDLDGNLVWLRGLTMDYPNVSNSLGMASSPLLVNGTLVVQAENDSESIALGLDPLTGANRWKIDRPKSANWTSPVAMKAGGQEVVALQSSKGVLGVLPETGSEVWNYTDGAATIPSSAAAGDVLFIPSNGLTAIRVPSDGGEVTQLWREEQQRPGTASPLVVDGKVYTINGAGVLSCGNIETGERLWRARLKAPFSGSPVAAGKTLYIFNEQGIGQSVDLSGAEGVVTGEVELNETILGTAAISNGAVYIRSDKSLWKFGK